MLINIQKIVWDRRTPTQHIADVSDYEDFLNWEDCEQEAWLCEILFKTFGDRPESFTFKPFKQF